MIKAEIISDTALQSLYEASIPCGACGNNPATLRSFCHGCSARTLAVQDPPPFYQCDPCHAKWYLHCTTCILVHGRIYHDVCGQLFYTVEDFSDYRRF